MQGRDILYINGKKLFVIMIAHIVVFLGYNYYYTYKSSLDDPSAWGVLPFLFMLYILVLPVAYLFIGIYYYMFLRYFHRYFDYSFKSYVYIGILSSIVNLTVLIFFLLLFFLDDISSSPLLFITNFITLIAEIISTQDFVIALTVILNFPTGFIFVMLYWLYARPDKHSLKPTKTDA